MATHNQDLWWAAENGDIALLKRFIEEYGMGVNCPDSEGDLPIHYAAQGDKPESIKYLLNKGASINSSNERYQTAVHWASHSGSLVALHTLYQEGADIRAADSAGFIGLHYAAQGGHILTAQYLLDAGLPIDALDSEDHTPLAWACYEGHHEMVAVLIRAGANIDKADLDGFTPLHWAAHRGYWHVANTLLQHNVDLTPVDMKGRTAEALALEKHNGKIAHLIHNYARAPAWVMKDRRFFGAVGFTLVLLVYWLLGMATPLMKFLLLGIGAVVLVIKRDTVVPQAMDIWPGPTRRNTFWFGATIATALLTVYIYLFHILRFTSPDSPFHIIFSFMIILSVSLTVYLHGRSPGYVPEDPDLVRTILDLSLKKEPLPQVCTVCKTKRPTRAHHCPVSNRCVLRYDHYNFRFDVCVGEHNHIFFMTASIAWLIVSNIFLYFVVQAMWRGGFSMLVFIAFFHHLFLNIWGGRCLLDQVLRVSKNITQFEQENPNQCQYLSGHNPFNRGTFGNVKSYLFSQEPVPHSQDLNV